MGANVFANGREISGKGADNKSLAAMPDICLSPPSPPAGPIPIPYPNFAMGSNTSSGSKKVKVGGKEAGIKNSSNYSESKGNEAATRSFGMGVISHTISGKMQHAAWSMDVKIESENAIRFMDLTTHNHGSGGNAALTTNIAKFQVGSAEASCKELDDANQQTQADLPQAPKTTVTTAHFKPEPPGSGPSLTTKAYSSLSKAKNKNGLCTGNKGDDGRYKSSALCPKADFEYKGKGWAGGPQSHTEARIIEDLLAMSPGAKGTLTMRIQWDTRPKGAAKPEMSPDTCPHCTKLVCAAKACGIIVKLCKSTEGPPEDPPCEA